MVRVKVLHQRLGARTDDDGEVIHLVAGCCHAGVVTLVDGHHAAAAHVVDRAVVVFMGIDKLGTKTMVRVEAELVDLLVLGLLRALLADPLGVVLVRWKSRPAARTHREQLAHQ